MKIKCNQVLILNDAVKKVLDEQDAQTRIKKRQYFFTLREAAVEAEKERDNVRKRFADEAGRVPQDKIPWANAALETALSAEVELDIDVDKAAFTQEQLIKANALEDVLTTLERYDLISNKTKEKK